MQANQQRIGGVSAECARTRRWANLAQSGFRAAMVARRAATGIRTSGRALRPAHGIAIALAHAALALSSNAAIALDAAATADERIFASGFEPNIVFVTSTTHTGNLGGLAGADAICQASAVNAGLHGTYRAWLSTTGVDALSRLGSARGWIRTDGQPVADTTADLASSQLFHPIEVDENGVFVNASGYIGVYTATLDDGTYFGQNCNAAGTVADWSTTNARTLFGNCTSDNAAFTSYLVGSCATVARLYCFGITAIHPVAP